MTKREPDTYFNVFELISAMVEDLVQQLVGSAC